MTLTTPTHPVALAERLAVHATRRGHSPKPIVLSTVATHCLFFGVESEMRASMIAALGDLAVSDPGRFADKYTALWDAQAAAVPYLRGHLDPFTGWLHHDSTGTQARALGDALIDSASLDLQDIAQAPGVTGDLLGQVLMATEAPGDRNARGAFYTPAGLAGLLADISAVSDYGTFNDPCCGAGGLAVATVRSMRRAGRRPATVTWALNDLDRTAVACAGLAMAMHGIPHVTLTCHDALSPAAAG